MSAIDSLMKRFGLVKLGKYGLVLTPEGRVMSTRPHVLDDGFGGKIVGWEDGDLAAAELERWPARQRPTSARTAAPPLPNARPGRVVAAPVAVVPERAAPLTMPAIVAAPAPVMPPAPVAPVVAEEPEEDDWEWTIAIARARAAAEETEHALAPPPPASRPVAAKPSRAPTVPARPLAVRPIPAKPIAPPQTPRMARGTPAPFPTHASPSTVIPVPSIPSVAPSQLAPVVRSQRVTRNVVPRTDLDDTRPAIPLHRPPTEDTVPHLVLPEPARAMALPSIKRLGRA